jgi:hypothetical protein
MIFGKIIEDAAGIAAFRFVKQGSAANGCLIPTVAGLACLGVVTGSNDNETFAQNEQVSIQTDGLGKVCLGYTLTAGDSFGVTVGGLAETSMSITTAAAAVHRFRGGRALESGVPGDIINAEIKCDWVPINP